MLPLLRKNVLRNVVSPRTRVWGQLTLVSAVLHIAVLLCLFVWYRSNTAFLVLHVHQHASTHNLPVVLVTALSPAQKNVQPEKQTCVVPAQHKAVPPKTRTTVQTKKVEQQQVAQKKPEPQAQPKPAQQKPQPAVQKKVAQKKEAVTKKETPQKTLEKIEPSNAFEGPVIVAQDYKEKIAIKQQQLLQQELVRVWQPPVGTADKTRCCIKVLIGSNGRIKQMDVVESSGVLLFDVAARSALCKAQLPQWTWGTTLDLTFS